jgi:hypothetical protein
MEGFIRGDRQVGAGNVRLLRPGARRDEDVLRRVTLAVDGDGMRAENDRAPAQDGGAGVDQGTFVDAIQAVDLAVLVGEQPRPVERRLCDIPAEVSRFLQVFADVRCVGKQLLRDAADVDAGAAEAPGFSDRDARAQVGGEAAGANAAGTPAYRE